MEGGRIGVVDGQPKMAECAALFRPTLAGANGGGAPKGTPDELG